MISLSMRGWMRMTANWEPAPAVVIFRDGIGVAVDGEAEHVAVEAHGGRHVKDLKEGTDAAHIDGHGFSEDALTQQRTILAEWMPRVALRVSTTSWDCSTMAW